MGLSVRWGEGGGCPDLRRQDDTDRGSGGQSAESTGTDKLVAGGKKGPGKHQKGVDYSGKTT